MYSKIISYYSIIAYDFNIIYIYNKVLRTLLESSNSLAEPKKLNQRLTKQYLFNLFNTCNSIFIDNFYSDV